MSHLQFSRAILSRDKIARENCRCDIGLRSVKRNNINTFKHTLCHHVSDLSLRYDRWTSGIRIFVAYNIVYSGMQTDTKCGFASVQIIIIIIVIPKRNLRFLAPQISYNPVSVIDRVRNFSPWDSSAMEAAKEIKFGT